MIDDFPSQQKIGSLLQQNNPVSSQHLFLPIMATNTPLLSDNRLEASGTEGSNGGPGVTFEDGKNRHGSTGRPTELGRPTTDSWGNYEDYAGSTERQSSSDPHSNVFVKFRKDLEKTAKRISQRRIDALQADVDNSMAKSQRGGLGDTAGSKLPVRRSRTEAAQNASEAGVDHNLLSQGGRADRSKLRRRR